MVQCAAYGCSNSTNNTKGVSFFAFPCNTLLKKRWIHNIKRDKFEPTKHSRVCSAHFSSDAFDREASKMAFYGYTGSRNYLKKDAVPTIYSFSPKTVPKERGAVQKRKRREILGLHLTSEKNTAPVTVSNQLNYTCTSESEYQVPCKIQILQNVGQRQDRDENLCPVYEQQLETLASEVSHSHPVPSKTQQTEKRTTTSNRSIQFQWKPLVRTRRIQVTSRPKTRDYATQVNFGKYQPDSPSCKSKQMLATCFSDDDSSETEAEDNESSYSQNHDIDPDYSPSDTEGDLSEYDSDDEDSSKVPFPIAQDDPFRERQLLVNEVCLMELLSICRTCRGCTQVWQKRLAGTLIVLEIICENGHKFTWCNQQLHSKLAWGNICMAAACLFSGSSPSKILTLFRHLNTPAISQRTYYRIQKCYLVPTVSHVWLEDQENLLSCRVSKPLVLGGDGRCDSPGFSAKYGSYNVMDLETKTILHTELVQVNEVKSSVHMELEGLKRSIKILKEKNCAIQDLVTDRHIQIRKYMREEQSSINHYFDVWHMSKSVNKKLEKACQKKKFIALQAWKKSICNHMFWVAGSCGNDGLLKREKWLSLLNHVANIHTGHGENFIKCEHGELDCEREWLIKGSKPYKMLQEIVTHKQLVKDISKLSPVHQTYSLEVFHNVVNHFSSKQQHYFYGAMQCRMYLAAMHFNENNNLEQKSTEDGELQWAVCFPKAQKGKSAVIKPVKERPTYEYIQRIKAALMRRKLQLPSYLSAGKDIHYTTMPNSVSSGYVSVSKSDLIAKHRSRFQK